MRKSKELKRTRRQAGLSFRRGNTEEAYKAWAEAAKGYKEKLDKKKAKKAGAKAEPAAS